MKEDVRPVKQLAQLRLRHETGEGDALGDAQFARELTHRFEQWAFASDRESRCGIRAREGGESAEAGGDSLLLHQAAGLHEPPLAVRRPGARAKWNLIERNA